MNNKVDALTDEEFKMDNKDMTKNNSTLIIQLARISINEISDNIGK